VILILIISLKNLLFLIDIGEVKTAKIRTRLAVVTELVAVFLFPLINNVAKSLILLVEKFDG